MKLFKVTETFRYILSVMVTIDSNQSSHGHLLAYITTVLLTQFPDGSSVRTRYSK